MKGFWKSPMLLALCLSGALRADNSHGCNETVVLIRTAVNSSVSVLCPSLMHEEMTFHLHMNSDEVASYRVDKNNISKDSVFPVNDGLNLSVTHQHHTVNFDILGVNIEQTGLYSCHAWISFPPPGSTVQDTPKMVIIVEDYQCPTKSLSSKASIPDSVAVAQHSCCESWWILAILLSIATAYGLVATATGFKCWIKLRNVELSQNDYFNTKSRVPMGHKKNGIQLPLPRWF